MTEPNSNKRSFIKSDTTTRLAWGGFRRWRAPIWLQLSVMAFVVLTWLPIAVAIEWRTDMRKPDPRIHLIQDMDAQPKLLPQAQSILFNDRRAERPRVAGTVARGELHNDPAFFNGYTESVGDGGKVTRTYVDTYPPAVQARLDDPEQARQFLTLGQQKFNLTCALCHGRDGHGNGPIALRAVSVGANQTGWAPPNDLTDEVRRSRSDGHLYNTINNGIRNMGGYGHQLSPEERWAVVAYVRTLQLAQAAPREVLTPEQQRALQ